MPWLLFAVPVVGIGLYLWLSQKDEAPVSTAPLAPPPGPVAPASGGTRAQQYMVRLDMALSGWRAAAIIPTQREAQRVVVQQTIDVVLLMATQDAAEGRITRADLQALEDRAKTVKAEVGG